MTLHEIGECYLVVGVGLVGKRFGVPYPFLCAGLSWWLLKLQLRI